MTIESASENKTVRLVLPLPPTANHIWKGAGKRIYLSPEYVAFKETVHRIWKENERPVLCGRLELSVMLHPKDRRKWDISNRVKALEDSLKKLVFADDEQIDILFVKRGPIVENGCCIVFIKELESTPQA